MPTSAYWAETATLTVEEGDDEIPVGALQNVSISASAEHVELWSMDTILREGVKRREASIDVEFEVAAFDEEFAQRWMGGGTGASTSIEDTSDVTLFTVSSTIEADDDEGNDLTVEVEDVYIDEMPIYDAQMGEWIMQNVTGNGKQISVEVPA